MNKKDIKKNHIIKTAAFVFSQKGYAKTLMTDIAKLAGIGKGTIYEYFASKEDLFFAVFEWFVADTQATATVSIKDLSGSASQRLRVMNDTIMNSWYQMKDLYTLTMEFWAASAASSMRERFKEAFRLLYKELRQMVAALIDDGIKSGEFRNQVDPEAVAAALVGTWDALFLQGWFEENFGLISVSNKFLDVVIKGLLVEEGAGPTNH